MRGGTHRVSPRAPSTDHPQIPWSRTVLLHEHSRAVLVGATRVRDGPGSLTGPSPTLPSSSPGSRRQVGRPYLKYQGGHSYCGNVREEDGPVEAWVGEAGVGGPGRGKTV